MPASTEYDPDYDNCAGGCRRNDSRRVAFSWFHQPAFACPGCYELIFGAAPCEGEPVIVLTAGQVGVGAR